MKESKTIHCFVDFYKILRLKNEISFFETPGPNFQISESVSDVIFFLGSISTSRPPFNEKKEN